MTKHPSFHRTARQIAAAVTGVVASGGMILLGSSAVDAASSTQVSEGGLRCLGRRAVDALTPTPRHDIRVGRAGDPHRRPTTFMSRLPRH